MKLIRKCPVFFLLILSGIVFTVFGVCGSKSIYSSFTFDIVRKPFLALTLEGMSEGLCPWELWDEEESKEVEMVLAQEQEDAGQRIEDFASAEEVAEEEEAGETEESDAVQDAYAFQAVTEDYFNDAVFIGDSRTVGMFEYGGIEERADFFAKISLTIYDVFTDTVGKDEETGKKITVEEALQKKQYGKVYLMLGINELGTGTVDSFMEEYRKVVTRLQELQPEAVIFVEGIMRVTGSKNEADPIFNNTNINLRNDEIAKLADNKNIFYIDVNEVVCDEEGNLNSDYTTDEIHLKAKYYENWKQFLLEHGVVRE